MLLVLIETSGNQNYIFSTNKLRENIGASQLTYLAGTKWVLSAVADIDNRNLPDLWTDEGNEQLRTKLLNPKLNPPIDKTNFSTEIILAASGKALLLVKEDKEDKYKYAREIIREVTLKALKESPGLEISGVIHEFDWNEKRSLISAVKTIHEKFEANKSQMPSAAMRYLRLPVIEECAFSGLPASGLEKNEKGDAIADGKAISKVCQTKRNQKKDGFQRIEALLKTQYPKTRFADSLNRLDPDFDDEASSKNSQVEWLGVIHADGNGLGKIFINFPQHLEKIKPDYDNRYYINELRKFSLALDSCTEKAFLSALSVFQYKAAKKKDKDLLPIFPLILGGDDLTVICNGRIALPFTKLFLTEFETETQNDGSISKIAEVALNGDRLSACAGVAIVKPHFPFSVAYNLAESLTTSAKQVKKIIFTKAQEKDTENIPYPCSAIDFHVLYDSSGVELDKIRQRLSVDSDRTLLYRRPYVVTPESNLLAAEGKDWQQAHRWELLKIWVDTIKATDEEGKPKLPNSQIYKLRENLVLGKKVTDSYYRLIKERYASQGIKKLEGDSNSHSLFITEPSIDSTKQEISATGLLDAIEAAEFI